MAQSLARQGVELIRGDFEDPASLERAAHGVYGIYSVQTFWAVGAKREIQQGRNVADGVQADKPYQTIAAADIGAFVALAFERPDAFIGQELEIAGSELTNPQAAEVFSRVLGKPVVFEELPLPVVRRVMSEEFYQMYRWFNEAEYQANIAELRRRYPEVHLHTLEDWLREEGWHKRARRVQAPHD